MLGVELGVCRDPSEKLLPFLGIPAAVPCGCGSGPPSACIRRKDWLGAQLCLIQGWCSGPLWSQISDLVNAITYIKRLQHKINAFCGSLIFFVIIKLINPLFCFLKDAARTPQ